MLSNLVSSHPFNQLLDGFNRIIGPDLTNKAQPVSKVEERLHSCRVGKLTRINDICFASNQTIQTQLQVVPFFRFKVSDIDQFSIPDFCRIEYGVQVGIDTVQRTD